VASNKFVGRWKETMEEANNHLKLFILNGNVPFLPMDIFKIDNNIRQLISLSLLITKKNAYTVQWRQIYS
jgi:hypothetical protein